MSIDAQGSTNRVSTELVQPVPHLDDNRLVALDAGTTEIDGASPPEVQINRIQEELALCASAPMKEIRSAITEAALINVTILITGETGTGKGLVARAIHYLSDRRSGPFVTVNCSAAHEFLASELFGHERGAPTDTRAPRTGKFERANHGTIFLDEIGDLHPTVQAKLLHVLEDGQFSRVGGWSSTDVDVRVVAATNHDLEACVAARRFREDLFYRLNVIRIALPPLRERPEDIPSLAQHFAQRYCHLFGREEFILPSDALLRLQRHPFPGNVRELQNMMKRMILLRDSGLTRPSRAGLKPRVSSPVSASKTVTVPGSVRTIPRMAPGAAEQSLILRTLETARWNRRRAASLLNISYRSLLYKIKAAGLDDSSGKTAELP